MEAKSFYVGPTIIGTPHNSVLGEEIIKALLHSVFFLRCFGTITPVDVLMEELRDVHYSKVQDAEIDAAVSQVARRFLDLQKAQASTGDIVLKFYKLESTQNWFAQRAQSKVCWEEWIFNFRFQEGELAAGGTSPERVTTVEDNAKLAGAVTRQLHYILKTANQQRDHIPFIPAGKALMPFEYTLEAPEVDAQPRPGFSLLKGISGIFGSGQK